MVRLSLETVEGAPQRLNPLGDRELILRALKIPSIENTGTFRDAYDCVDLSDNEIKRLGNFTRSARLSTLLLNNNKVSRIQPSLGDELPNLKILVLTGNAIESLSEIDNLAACARLESLSLIDNPICQSPHYRPYVIAKAPDSLKLLDFRKVKAVERSEALKIFPRDKPPAVDVTKPTPPPPRRTNQLTDQQLDQIKAAVEAAKTAEEVDAIERQIKAGLMPAVPRPPPGPPPQSNVQSTNGKNHHDVPAAPPPTPTPSGDAAAAAPMSKQSEDADVEMMPASTEASSPTAPPPRSAGEDADVEMTAPSAPTEDSAPPPLPENGATQASEDDKAASSPAPAESGTNVATLEKDAAAPAPPAVEEAEEGAGPAQSSSADAAGAEAEADDAEVEAEEKEENSLTREEVDKMTVVQLKKELSLRYLRLTGRKAELKQRLLEALEEET